MQHILKNIPLPQTSKRIDCPYCGGKNTLSISNLGLLTLFYCFKSSCTLKGRVQNDIDIDNLKVIFKFPEKTKKCLLNLDTFLFIPELNHNAQVKKYLQYNGCWNAYRNGRADIRYDPYEDRVVFIIYSTDSTNIPVSAIGRSLVPNTLPKWKKYGGVSKPFICPENIEHKSKTLVIVEDCCSACAVSSYYDSAALLGTYLKDDYIKDFLAYDKLIIALDKDASKVAFSMQKELQSYKPTSIILLEEDLKHLSLKEIGSILNV